jgi:hypothetical protein
MSEKFKITHEDINISDLSLFRPKSARALFEDYPELANYPECKEVTSVQLLFAWYYACESSPIYKMRHPGQRAEEAIKLTFDSIKGAKKLSHEQRVNYKNARFDEKMAAAIKVMGRFRLNPRIRAKMMTEKVFDNFEKVLSIDAGDNSNFMNKDGDVDYAKKKAYVDMASKAIDMLPTLIERLESSYSVSKTTAGNDEDESGNSFADLFHDLKQE